MKNRIAAVKIVALSAALSLGLAAACATAPGTTGAGAQSAAQQTAPGAGAQTAAQPTAPRAGRKLLIVGINDTHGALLPAPAPKWLAKQTTDEVGGIDWFAGWMTALRREARKNGDDVVILDGGDMFQGTLISNQFQGRSVVDAYDAIGVTAAAVGNHEFDFGLAVLKDRMAQAKFPVLTANVFLKGTDKRPDWAKPSVIVDAAGTKVGIIGLSTVETATTTNPLNIAEFEFRDAGPIAAKEADELRKKGAKIVLITAHCGPKGGDSLGANEIQHIAEHVKGKVQAIVSGHHHESINVPLVVAGIPIVQSGSKLVAFSTIALTLDENGYARQFSVNAESYPRPGAPQPILHTYEGLRAQYKGQDVEPDAKVAALIHEYDVQVKKLRESTIGATQVALQKGGKDDLLANLTSDALRAGLGGGLKAQFAFQNSGGLRISEIPAGAITFGQIFDLYPFDNQQMVVSLPAPQVRDALESILRAGKGALKVSGMRYTIDWEKFGAGKDVKAAPAGAIVTEIVETDTGKPVCVTKSCTATACASECAPGTYTVSVTDFLANGGDGLNMLRDAPRQVGSVLARDLVVAYVKEHSPLTAQSLGALSAGAQPRIVQHGTTKSQGEQQ